MELDDINSITVLGAGNMGHGIAEVAALSGYDVNLRDIEEEFVQNGYEQIEWSLDKLAEKERIGEDEAEAALERVTPLVDLETAVEDADVVIEAVPEKMEIKKDVYGDLEAYAPDRTVFATNTSSLSITELSEVTERPERFCGMHFFNPPVRMQLVEVISGEHTADATLDLIEDLAEAMDKTPVRVRKDSPGFVVNRVLVPLMNEAAWMVHEDEATVAEVDSTAKYGMGLPMGLFELMDQVGLDVGLHVQEYMEEVLGDAYAPCPMTEEKIEAGHLGKKSGKGIYDYEDGEGAQIPTDEVSEEIETRLVAMMANEVAALVANDVADADGIDQAMQLGAGFPDGPAKMADEAGIDTLVAALDERHEETDEERYVANDHLRDLAESGEGFYGDGGESDESETTFEEIRVERDGRVGRIVLDRPHRMNALTHDLLDELVEAVESFEADDETRSILITGAGDRAFSSGADLTATASGANHLDAVDQISRKGQSTFGRLKESPLPVVAGIDGYCLGGGMELSMCADLRVASERSEFGQTEFRWGLLPGWGGTQRLQRIVGEGRAKEIIFTAERFDAETMADYDFVNEVTENDELEERALDLARDLAGGPPLAMKFTKRAMHNGWENMDAGLEIEAQAFGHIIESEDVMEGISAFAEDREPEFEGK
jgi:enoyl-CoA hydratase/3-hydroxyacyl-CoA dehydrogenase